MNDKRQEALNAVYAYLNEVIPDYDQDNPEVSEQAEIKEFAGLFLEMFRELRCSGIDPILAIHASWVKYVNSMEDESMSYEYANTMAQLEEVMAKLAELSKTPHGYTRS